MQKIIKQWIQIKNNRMMLSQKRQAYDNMDSTKKEEKN